MPFLIDFSSIPNKRSSDIAIRKNLFAKTKLAEARIRENYAPDQFREMLTTPLPVELNWSDRPAPEVPISGEVEILFERGGRRGDIEFAFETTDATDPRFLTPTTASPQVNINSPQDYNMKWVGALRN